MESNQTTVEFICSNNRKIIIDFILDENGILDYKPHFEPQEIDPKEDLGLGGLLCQIFLNSLTDQSQLDDTNKESSVSEN